MDFGNLFYSKKELLIISESYIRVERDIKLVAAVGCVLLHFILLDFNYLVLTVELSPDDVGE